MVNFEDRNLRNLLLYINLRTVRYLNQEFLFKNDLFMKNIVVVSVELKLTCSILSKSAVEILIVSMYIYCY